MSKVILDKKTRDKFVKIGKKGGDTTKKNQPPDYYSKIGAKTWDARVAAIGIDAVRAQMSEAAKRSWDARRKKKLEAERKNRIGGISGRLHKFLTKGELD